MSLFRKASRKNTKLRLALIGPSGSGKTLTALRIARGKGCKKIAVIDTENGSSELYADMILDDAKEWGPFQFDVAVMSAPFTVDKYIRAVNDAVAEGYDCVIIDSASHAWAGEGGILQQKERMDARGGSSFNNWGKLTPEQEKFKNMVLHNKIHLMITMRTKTAYVIEENEKGKSAPRKVGLAPIQRDGFEYEFDLVMNIAEDHHFMQSKDRTNMFGDHIWLGDEKIGLKLKEWLESGAAEVAREEEAKEIEQKTTPTKSPKDETCQKNTAKNNAPSAKSGGNSEPPKTSKKLATKKQKPSSSASPASAESSANATSPKPPENSSTPNGEKENGNDGNSNSSTPSKTETSDDALAPGVDPKSMALEQLGSFEILVPLGDIPKGTMIKDIPELQEQRDKLEAAIFDRYKAQKAVPETWNETLDGMDAFLGGPQ